MYNFLRENIGWIKDFLTAILSSVATLIAILTYNRAKHTLLQPVRTEVIKKQTSILTELLSSIGKSRTGVEDLINYETLVSINIYEMLKRLGFIFKDKENIDNFLHNQVCGCMYSDKTINIPDVEIVGAFSNSPTQEDLRSIEELRRKQYLNAKAGEIDIDRIYFSKQYNEAINLISKYKNDPFMPTTIQNLLEQLLCDVNKNVTVFLKISLEEFFVQYFERTNISNDFPTFTPAGVYNEFNHKRIHHNVKLDEIRKEIRKYLMVDSMPY